MGPAGGGWGLPGPAAALEENKFRRRPHAPPRAQGAAFQAPEAPCCFHRHKQLASGPPARLPACPPSSAKGRRHGCGTRSSPGRWLRPARTAGRPRSARAAASSQTPAQQDSPPSPTESGRPPSKVGELALPQQRSSVDRGPLTHPGGGGTQSQIHDRHRNNKFIIRTTEDTVMHIQKEGTSLQQRASWPTPQQEPTVSQNAGSEDSILTRAGPVPNTQTAPGARATQAPCSRGPQRRAGSRPGGRRGGEALQPAPSPGAPRPWSGNAACIFRASYVLHALGNGRRLSGTHTHQGSRRTPWCQVDTGPAEDSSPQAQGWGVAGVSPLMEVCGWSRGGRKAEELT